MSLLSVAVMKRAELALHVELVGQHRGVCQFLK